MYLKSIEVQGFKSFANKTVLDFSPGITGIVGPNGSGKSNISDAVRWVLGEQKVKQLRGASMQDVIFAGTATRRPQNYASVSISFDNSDHALSLPYEEITVSRRLYRSGESEYRLNGSECRLKDIHELFYDTGIGKEGYSLIGQGQIDKILSGKAEERRALFDEAVGIVKFKRRKDIAEKKLEEEQCHMTEISLSDSAEKIAGLDGIICTGTFTNEMLERLSAWKKPIVMIDCNADLEHCDTITVDYKNAVRDLLDFLIEKGHTKIGFIGGGAERWLDRQSEDPRYTEFCAYLKEKNLFCERYVKSGQHEARYGRLLFTELYREGNLPTAIFAANDSIAAGIYRAAYEFGLKIPEDISVIGFNDIPGAKYMVPPLTTVRLYMEFMGEYAVTLLSERIQESREINIKIMVPTKLRVRNSVREL